VDGVAAHTYYVASNEHTAYLESVLHDVPLETLSSFPLARLAHFHLVKLQFTQALRFVSFHTAYLPKLEVTRAELIDSLTDAYPFTQQWAAAAFTQEPAAQAIGYGSRRHDAGRCLMLMRQRMPDPPFQVLEDHCIGTTPALRRDIIDLMDRLDIDML
jgi:hypothetical protein